MCVCVDMKPHNVMEDQIKLREFPFAVQDRAKDWIYDLPLGMVNTWVDLACLLLDKLIPRNESLNPKKMNNQDQTTQERSLSNILGKV